MTLRSNQICTTKHDAEVGTEAIHPVFPQDLTMPILSGFLHNLTTSR